jgi:hypothetical protein
MIIQIDNGTNPAFCPARVLGVKRQKNESSYLPHSGTEVKNTWSLPPLYFAVNKDTFRLCFHGFLGVVNV